MAPPNTTQDTANQRAAQTQRTILPRPSGQPHGLPHLPPPSHLPSTQPLRPQPPAYTAHKQSAINHIHDGEAGYRENRELHHTHNKAAQLAEFQQRVRDMAALYRGEDARMEQNYKEDIARSEAREVNLVSEVEADFTLDPMAAEKKWASLGTSGNQGTEDGDRVVAGKKRVSERAPHGLPYPKRQNVTQAEVPEADRIMIVESE